MAKLIEQADRPALVLAHNKTLAASCITSSRDFFQRTPSSISSSTTIFTSLKRMFPSADIYIDKEATINDERDKLRMSATRSLSNAATL